MKNIIRRFQLRENQENAIYLPKKYKVIGISYNNFWSDDILYIHIAFDEDDLPYEPIYVYIKSGAKDIECNNNDELIGFINSKLSGNTYYVFLKK